MCGNCGKRFSHSGSYSSHMTSKKCYAYPQSGLNASLHTSPTQVPPSASATNNPSVAALLATRSMLNFGPFALAALAAAAAQQQQTPQTKRKDSYSSTPKSHSPSPSPPTWPNLSASIPLTTPPSSSSSDRNNNNALNEIEAGEIPNITSPARKRKRRNFLSNDQDNSMLSSGSSTDLLDKQQLNMLRAHYALNPYPNANELHEISKRVGLSEQHVQHWFQVLRTSYATASNGKPSTNAFIPSAMSGGASLANASNMNNASNTGTTPFLPLAYYHLRASLMAAAASNNSSVPPPPLSVPLSFPSMTLNTSKEQTEPLDLTVKKSHMKSGEQITAHLHMSNSNAFNNENTWYENKNEWNKVVFNINIC